MCLSKASEFGDKHTNTARSFPIFCMRPLLDDVIGIFEILLWKNATSSQCCCHINQRCVSSRAQTDYIIFLLRSKDDIIWYYVQNIK